MPIRGERSIYPNPGKSPTGIFKQPQKNDSTAEFEHKAAQAYAHSHNRKRAKMGNNQSSQGTEQGLRHQKPKRMW